MTDISKPPAVDVEQLRAAVGDIYRGVAERPDADYHFHTGRKALAHLGYPSKVTDPLPDAAADAFAGVANVFEPGLPDPGEHVIDVGSGAGADALIAARAVGDDGAVVGVDMNESMLDRARGSAADLGVTNTSFKVGLIEELPVEDEWADVIISNGVLNLVPDKLTAYQELFRVTRPGGRLQISDICVEEEVPEEAKQDIDLWGA